MAEARESGTIDRDLKSLLALASPLHYGDYVWNDAGVPRGPTWIRIDLRSQLISARVHRSSLYDAKMPYTLRLTGDGVSIHASSVRSGAATHGCIGVPLGFARRLFETSKVGDEVVIVASTRPS